MAQCQAPKGGVRVCNQQEFRCRECGNRGCGNTECKNQGFERGTGRCLKCGKAWRTTE